MRPVYLTRQLLIGYMLLIALPSSALGAVCSKINSYGVRLSGRVFMIGRALADTTVAGPGSVEYRIAPGHFGQAKDRSIYGQIVDVERIGRGPAGLPSRESRAVLVPWDYGPDCIPTPWTQSARWLVPGARSLFHGQLRERAHWANGLPTFDVHDPGTVPYPQRVGARAPTDSLLTIEQLFELTELLPEFTDLNRSPREVLRPLFTWARSYPDLARRFPAPDALWRAYHAIDQHQLRSIVPAIAGTYRLTFSLGGAASRVFYARTNAIPTAAWSLVQVERPTDPLAEPPTPQGYSLLVSGALSVDALPVSCEQRAANREGYFNALDSGKPLIEVTMVWPGKIEPNLLAALLPGDVALRDFARGDYTRFTGRWSAGLPQETPAKFTRARDGSILVEQTITLDDGRTLSITGARVSELVIACRW